MKKMLLALSAWCLLGTAKGDIRFGSNDDLLTITESAALVYDAADEAVVEKGSFHFAQPHLVGMPLRFGGGLIQEKEGVCARVTNGEYGFSESAATFSFAGNGILEGFNNFKLHRVSWSGSNNAIKGSFDLVNPLYLGEDLTISCGFTTPVNNALVLSGTTLSLDADLVFANDAHFTGYGLIQGNGHSVVFGNYYHSALSQTLVWSGCDDIQLQGSIVLDGRWYFFGDCCINGNGATLDLRREATALWFSPGSRVTFRNITIKGLNPDSFVFYRDVETAPDPTVILDGARFYFTDSVSLSYGSVEVRGDSIFSLGNYDFSCIDDARLVVDAATLSINVLSNEEEAATGTIFAPHPLFVDHVKRTDNIASNIEAGNLVFSDRGVVAEVSQVLTSGLAHHGETIALDTTTILTPSDCVTFTENATVDGSGSRITFANAGVPQFVIAPGKRVRLSNIELHAITGTTFSLGAGAVLELGEKVIFTLAENVTWSEGQIVLVGTGTIFEIRSLGAPCVWKFESPARGDEPHELTYESHLALGTNSLLLRDSVLHGLRHIFYGTEETEEGVFVGEIILGGGALICVQELVVDHCFTISGLNNAIRLLQATSTFSGGSISFDAQGVNQLSFTSLLPSSAYGPPVIHFWDSAFDLSSAEGAAYCSFSMPSVILHNRAANAFTFGPNGTLAGKSITVVDNPIAQTSARTAIEPGTVLSSSMAAGALSFSDDLLAAMRGPACQERKPGRMRHKKNPFSRSVSLPNESLKPVVHFASALALPVLAGNVTLEESYGHSYMNMRISADQPLNLTLYNGVRVMQAEETMTLKADDILNVVGGTIAQPNVLRLSRSCTINGSIMLDDNAVLCIETAPHVDDASLYFNSSSVISFGQRSTLLLNGLSFVSLPDEATISFGETQSSFIVGKGTRLFLSEGQQVTLTGSGTLQCQEAGHIALGRGAILRCGLDHADRITVRLKEGGTLRVGGVLSTSESISYLSFGRGVHTLDCSQGGRLVITGRGVCECNKREGGSVSSTLQTIDFSGGGSLNIAAHGLLSFANNASGDGINLFLDGAVLSGAGLVGVEGSSFQGKLQQNVTSAVALSAVAVTRLLVQTQSNLLYATVYIDADGQRMLRTKNGALVPLSPNQVITGDTSAGVVTGYNALTGRRFSYDANGVLPS